MADNKKQTAVDILHSQMMGLICNNELSDQEKVTMGHNLFYENKQMEREQMKDMFLIGDEYGYKRCYYNGNHTDIDFYEMYEETYGKKT